MTEEQVMMKMRASAVEFKNLAREHRYVRAINLYYRVSAVASYIELSDDKRAELFGRQTDEGIVIKGLFEKEYVAWVSDKAMQEEIEQNRCGNPTQIHDFKTYLPRSYFSSGRLTEYH